ncbi:ethionine resistance protein, partial [Coemansia sp. RSA 2320]
PLPLPPPQHAGLGESECDIDAEGVWAPANMRAEAVWLLRSSFPIVMSSLSQLLLMVPMLAAVGKLGTVALASMNLVSIYSGLGGIAPLSGMAMALDSLCSQAYTGSRDRRLLGVYLQRVLLCIVMVLVLIYPLWWNAAIIYRHLGVPLAVAEVTGRLLRMYFFGVAVLMVYECLKSYLFAQGVRGFAVAAQAVGLPLGWLSIWLLISNDATSLGVLGVPYVVMVVGLSFSAVALLYMRRVDSCRQCWGGWTRDAFSDLRPVLKLGLAGSAVAFFESVSLHLIDLGSLFLSAEHMAAQAILSVLMTSTWVLGTGFAVAACNRVGNLLGSRQPNRTHLAVNTTLLLAAGGFLALGVVVFGARNMLPAAFTDDEQVAAILRFHVVWPAAAGAVQGVNMACSGILRGQGRQVLIARIRVLSVVCVGIPLGVISVAVLRWDLAGLWLAYFASLVAALCALLAAVFATNWDNEIDRCQRRVYKAMLATTPELDPAACVPVLPLATP